jgi:very-short-patch-repair endonuclease
MWGWLRNRTMFGLKFRRQHPVDRYILDFYCAELKLCIELDGGVHNHLSQTIHDDHRTCALSALGITVVRLWNDDIREHPCESWDFIVAAVARLVSESTGKR